MKTKTITVNNNYFVFGNLMENKKKSGVITIALDRQDESRLETAKEKSGIKSTSDVIRHILKMYTDPIFTHPSLRERK